MKTILFIGDIFGRPGRNFVKQALPGLIKEHSLDFVIANAENSAGGSGVTKAICEELHSAGVDAITLGDHVWDQKDFANDIDSLAYVCRPANLPSLAPGRPYLVIEKNNFRLGIFTMLGQAFMKIKADSPFIKTQELLPVLKTQTDAIFAEIHAEATAEKIAYGWFLDGQVALVAGTHTHVPTADAQILPGKTAYITDAGMTGPYDSVIGSEKATILAQFMDGMPRRYTVAEGNVQLHGVLVTIDEQTGLAAAISKITVCKNA